MLEKERKGEKKVAVETVLGPRWITATNLNPRGRLFSGKESDVLDLEVGPLVEGRVNISRSWNEEYSVQDFETCYYFLGLVLSDGCLRDKWNVVHFGNKYRDRPVFEELVKRFKSVASLRPTLHPYSFTCDVDFSSWLMKKFLVEHGVTTNKSLREAYRQIPDEYYFDFLRGYFDGDGTASVVEIRFHGGEGLVGQIRSDVKRLLGVDGKIHLMPKRYPTAQQIFYLEYGVDEALQIFIQMYRKASIGMARKRDMCFRKRTRRFYRLRSPEGQVSWWGSLVTASLHSGVSTSNLSSIVLHKISQCSGWTVKRWRLPKWGTLQESLSDQAVSEAYQEAKKRKK